MRARLYSDGVEIAINPFLERYFGGVCSAVVASLKAPRPEKNFSIEVEGEQVRLEVDSTPLTLDRNQGFAGIIVHDTIRGMLGKLKGISAQGHVRIVVEIADHKRPL